MRDSAIGGWSNGVWNQVFSGVQGAPAQSFPNPPYTTLPASPVTEEKPYLYVDPSGAYRMFVKSSPRAAASGNASMFLALHVIEDQGKGDEVLEIFRGDLELKLLLDD